VGEELREADGGGFGTVDDGIAVGLKGGDGEGHGDAVVGAGVDLGAVDVLIAGDGEAVLVFGEFGSHGLEIFGDESDAVGLFDAEFLCVADGDAVVGVRGDGGEDGEFIDDLGGERAADVHAAWAVGGAVNLNGADEFAVMLFNVEDFYFSAECGDDVEERGSGGVHADGIENEIGVGEEEGGAEEEGGGGEVARDGGVDGF